MNENRNTLETLNWLLDEMVTGVAHTRYAVVLSDDGLLMARSKELNKNDSDQLSAMSSSLQSLAKGVSRQFDGGPVLQVMVEMERGYLFVAAAGKGACLAVLTDEDVDITAISAAMQRIVERVGPFMSSAPRATAGPRGRELASG